MTWSIAVAVLTAFSGIAWFGAPRSTRPLASRANGLGEDDVESGRSGRLASTIEVPWWLAFPPVMIGGIVVSSPAVVLSGPILVTALTVGYRRWRVHRNRRAVALSVVEFVDRLGLELRSGSSLPPAVRRAVDEAPDPLGPIVHDVDRALSAGESVDVAIRRMMGVDERLDLVAVTLSVLTGNGGPAAAALDRVSDTLHEGATSDAEARSQSSQAVASAVVMAAIPVVFVAVVALVEPRAASFYFESLAGGICVSVALGLVAIGLGWIDRALGALR